MSSCPKITIVTPSFNQGAFISEALLSVKQQNYSELEHLVIDGGSTDGTLDILRECSTKPEWKHLHWVSEPDAGQSDALNKGFRAATGDLVGWLNSDDRYRPGAFASILDAVRSRPEADIYYGDYTFMDSQGRIRRIRREIEFNRFILHYHRVLYIPTTTTFFRRRIFDDGNFLDVQLQLAMDYDFFLRLAQRGYGFKHVNALIADFRLHSESKTGSFCEQQLKEHDMLARKYSLALSRFRNRGSRAIVFHSLRLTAAALRYGEKFLRGYYFELPSTAEIRKSTA